MTAYQASKIKVDISKQLLFKRMKFVWICVLPILVLSACADTSTETAHQLSDLFNRGSWVDLTHSFNANTIYWPTADNFRKDTVFVGITDNGFYYEAFNLFGAEHGGTHMDAPIHFSEGRNAAEEVSLSSLMGPLALVNVSDSASANRNYQVTVNDILRWEAENGTTVDRHILFVNTGSAKFWPDPVAYMGTDKKGFIGVLSLSFPGLHPEAAKWLTEEREILAFGLDTPSIDYGQSKLFETHRHLYEANIPGFENVANLDQLPAKGAYVIALPMKVEGGSGAPARIIAWVP
jgi:kynurenine formamidase